MFKVAAAAAFVFSFNFYLFLSSFHSPIFGLGGTSNCMFFFPDSRTSFQYIVFVDVFLVQVQIHFLSCIFKYLIILYLQFPN